MKTTLHYYRFDVSDPEDKANHQLLCQKLNGLGLKCFASYSPGHRDFYTNKIKPLDGQEITLETGTLFDNQWNTAPIEGITENGLRVFDWSQPIYDNKDIKSGMWLEQTPEMQEIRRNTYKCGWCGNQEAAAKEYVFCPACLGGEYLSENNLFMTRMLPVEQHLPDRPQLTDGEKAHLLPLYVEAQTKEGHSRHNKNMRKKRERIADKFERKQGNALAERDGFTWLLDNDVNIDNCIFYSHTGRFCFGWRSPVSPAVKSALLDVLVEFPFDYDIKAEV